MNPLWGLRITWWLDKKSGIKRSERTIQVESIFHFFIGEEKRHKSPKAIMVNYSSFPILVEICDTFEMSVWVSEPFVNIVCVYCSGTYWCLILSRTLYNPLFLIYNVQVRYK